MRAGEQRGYTFVAVLALLALCMLGLSIAGPIWSHQVRREREQELLRIGQLYAQAIAAYYQSSPGTLKQYPERLDQLLADKRFVGTRRHLRALYPDPINPDQGWGLVLDAQQRVRGVYSKSAEAPIAAAPQSLAGTSLTTASRYEDWKFIAKVTTP